MKDKNKDNADRFELTELFMARAGKKNWDRCFYGTITREKDSEGKEISVSGKIKMDEGYIWSRAANTEILGDNLDDLAELRLDYDINETQIPQSKMKFGLFYHN